jgi:hypothetical protein
MGSTVMGTIGAGVSVNDTYVGGEFDDLLIGALVAMLVYIPGELASLAAILVIYLSAAKQGY